jgi:hypothetical protein
MPRRLSEYDRDDWFRLRPLTHRLKTVRYRIINRLYARRPAHEGDVASLEGRLRGRNVLVTVAFDDPEAILWQSRLVQRYVPNALYLVADNSASETQAAAIAATAHVRDIPYVRLPVNPWRGPSRSHGLALNWIWRNVIRLGQPHAFGFIDDDIFPTAPSDPFAPLATQDFYGVVRTVGLRWFLWAGYCMFRFDRVKDLPLDFGQDWFAGLDTGGGNWDVLYRHVELAGLRQMGTTWVPYKEGVDPARGRLQWCDTWLHQIGSTGDRDLDTDKRRVVAAMLAPHLADAAG